jgi:exodeoxyribonuclease VII small subunit
MAKNNLSFEEKIRKIETILDELESGEMPVDSLLKEYETGMNLIIECREFLNKSEMKINELNKK